MAVDSNGYVLEVNTTTASIHDFKGTIRLIARILCRFKDVVSIKADIGYVPLKNTICDIDGIFLDCVKSNFGTSNFIPIQGRWVVNTLIQKNGSRLSYPHIYDSLLFRKKLPIYGIFSVNFAKSHRSCSSLHSLFNLRNFLENKPPCVNIFCGKRSWSVVRRNQGVHERGIRKVYSLFIDFLQEVSEVLLRFKEEVKGMSEEIRIVIGKSGIVYVMTTVNGN